jgi:hypothetical protein
MVQLIPTETYRLYEHGKIFAQNGVVAVRMGMAVLTYDGQPAGYVAAAGYEAGGALASQLVISAAQAPHHYRLVPVSFVSRVEQNRVWLNLAQVAINHLPVRHGQL